MQHSRASVVINGVVTNVVTSVVGGGVVGGGVVVVVASVRLQINRVATMHVAMQYYRQ